MMEKFNIETRKLESHENLDLRLIKISADDISFTRLIRQGKSEQDDYLCVPPAQLAFWLIDNWWRLRWEPPLGAFRPEWRLAHDLSSIGGGYIWPRVVLWGEEHRMGIASFPDDADSLEFITRGSFYLAASVVESGIDQFINSLLEETISDCQALRVAYEALLQERDDDGIAAWRKLEAKLGFDVDEAPEALMEDLAVLIEQYGEEGIEEVALAHQGATSATVLQEEIEAARTSEIRMEVPKAVKEVQIGPHRASMPPWQLAEEAAATLREQLSIPSGPIRNKSLSDILAVDVNTFQYKPGHSPLKYGIRLKDGDGEASLVALEKRRPHARRFELCRMLGDVIWSDNDSLGPVSAAKSLRQKFQRGFAQSFLCPFADLEEYIETDHPTNEDVQAAAHHFHVSDLMVQSLLVNKGVMARSEVEEWIDAA